MSDGSFLGTTGGREMLPSEVDAQSTHATGWVNNERQFMPLLDTFHSGGGPHAEDKLKQFIETHNIRDTVLCVYLTKSHAPVQNEMDARRPGRDARKCWKRLPGSAI